MRRIVGGAVGPVGVAGMGQGHVARAQRIHLTQGRQAVVDLVAALDADQRGHAAGLVDALDVGGGVGHFQVGGPALGHGLDQVDLLDGHLHGGRSGDAGRDPHRPELPPDLAGAQTRNVGHQRDLVAGQGQVGGVGLQVDAIQLAAETVADLPGQVVVAVDQGRLAEDAVDAGGEIGVRLDRRRLRRGGSKAHRRQHCACGHSAFDAHPPLHPHTIGRRSFHGHSFSNCAARRNSVASSA